MVHAFARFVQEQADDRGWRNRDLAKASGLTAQVCSNHLRDKRDSINRLPHRQTVEAFAKAFNVSVEFLLGKAIESLDLGYTSGDFVNDVHQSSNEELLAEIARRLGEAGEGHEDSSPSMKDPDVGGTVIPLPTATSGDELDRDHQVVDDSPQHSVGKTTRSAARTDQPKKKS